MIITIGTTNLYTSTILENDAVLLENDSVILDESWAGIKQLFKRGSLGIHHTIEEPSTAEMTGMDAAGAWALAKGTSGQFLTQGANDPAWASPAAADITFAATAKILGRKTAGGGTGEECSLSEILDLIGSPAQGDLLYRGASTWARLGAGSAGQGLISGGASANPSWDSSRLDGWITAPAFTYAASDAPSYTVTITGDYSAIIMAGMRIKLTDSTVKYFIITKSEYSAPNTTLTLYGGTDYTLSGGAISSPFYSMVKAPAGFPLDPLKWTTSLISTADRVRSTPTATTWYNAESLSIPVGAWHIRYGCQAYCDAPSGAADIWVTLSTANNSESNSEWTRRSYNASGDTLASVEKAGRMTLSAKATYYLNMKTNISSITSISIVGSTIKTAIEAVCAYL